MNRRNLSLAAFAFAFAALAAALTPDSGYAQAPATATPAAAPTQPPPPPEIEVGQIAPDFSIPGADVSGPRAAPFKLSDYRGKVVVLAFYPADRSSGCTKELTKFRELGPGSREARMMEVGSHPATDDFGIPEVNGSRQGDRGGRPERRRRPHHRADVSRILDAVQHE